MGVPISTFTRAAAVAALIALSLPVFAGESRQPAPRFKGKTIDGERFTTDTLKGKVVLIQFWRTWCQHCRADQDAVDSLAKDFADKGLVVLAVNTGESKREVAEYLKNSPRSCKIVLAADTNLAAKFEALGYPQYILIDRDGNIAGKQQGSVGDAALRRLVAGVIPGN